MTDYRLLWLVHVCAAMLSIALFLVRLGMDEAGRDWRRTPLRVLPHINDTVLLAAAVGLCVVTGWRPWADAWLGLKVTLLLVYIGLAAAAFRQTRRPPARWLAAAALCTVAGIVWLAIYRPAFG
ncbi:MAG: SirB2 family protein [Alcanivoracaceae bacterium]|jgi:uncharacterized membrane protein SirB2|nr:SirB2 family protein [Alcanivoracaceae bacterium]